MTTTKKSPTKIGRQPGVINVSLFLHTIGLPSAVSLRDNSIKYVGQDDSGRSQPFLIAGYATQGKQALFEMATAWSARNSTNSRAWLTLSLDVQYQLHQYLVGALSPTGRDHEPEWLDLDHLKLSVRDYLTEFWLDRIRKDCGTHTHNRVSSYPLTKLAALYPEYVAHYMRKEDPNLMMIRHDIHPDIAPNSLLKVATLRYDPGRIISAQVRFMPNLRVVV